jgi:hypothetical protein
MSTSRNEAEARFDAPRPTITNRLGKKRTDELIRADGDTWQEYLAVSEKAHTTRYSNASTRGGALSFFGKKNKKKHSSNSTSNVATNKTNGSSSSNLTIRSYFQNLRTGKKVWDEPPSGASITVPASEEMRRMAELQLDELHVVATHAADIEDLGESAHSTSSNNNNSNSKKKKSLGGGIFRRGNNTSGSNGGTKGENANSGGSANNGSRIRYKPNSKLNTTRNASAAGSAATINDRQLQEAIERSMAETFSCGVAESKSNAGNDNAETEEEILRRVLEESRLEAANNNCYNDDDDRKPAARKNPPTNTGFVDPYIKNHIPSLINVPNETDQQQQQQQPWMSSASSTAARRRSPSGGGNKASRRSRSNKDQSGFV